MAAMLNGLRFIVNREFFHRNISLNIIAYTGAPGSEPASYATNVTFEQIPEGVSMFGRKNLLELDNTQAQDLMDQLWQCGLRPSEGSGSAGSLAATQAHLDDFRRLVFKKEYTPRKS